MATNRIVELDKCFVEKHLDYEKYALVHSSTFYDIFKVKLNETSNNYILEGLVKIKGKGKPIYRKCIGRNISGEVIGLGYRSRCELKCRIDDEVSVEKACWWSYYWRNSDSGIKWPFRIAVISLLITLIGSVFSVMGAFI